MPVFGAGAQSHHLDGGESPTGTGCRERSRRSGSVQRRIRRNGRQRTVNLPGETCAKLRRRRGEGGRRRRPHDTGAKALRTEGRGRRSNRECGAGPSRRVTPTNIKRLTGVVSDPYAVYDLKGLPDSVYCRHSLTYDVNETIFILDHKTRSNEFHWIYPSFQ